MSVFAKFFNHRDAFQKYSHVILFGFVCVSGQVESFVKSLVDEVSTFKNFRSKKKTSKIKANLLLPISMNDVMGWLHHSHLKAAIKEFTIRTTDGMPLVWLARLKGNKMVGRLYGPTVMQLVIGYGRAQQLRHFFYGGTDEILESMVNRLTEMYPGFREAGRYAPPFRDLNEQEFMTVTKMIDQSQADIVWVGIGGWKQIIFAVKLQTHLKKVILVAAVGAAFDFISRFKPQAPAWMQTIGLEWLYRLASEPRRLWRRYILQIPSFIVFSILDTFNYYKPIKTSSRK